MDALMDSIFSQSGSMFTDPKHRREMLKKDLDRIFQTHGGVDVWEVDNESQSIRETRFDSAHEFIAQHTTRNQQSLGNCFFCISQGNSWSRLTVSAELMLQIILSYRLDPILVDFIHCYGVKVTGDDNPYYGTFHAAFALPEPTSLNSGARSYDFCCHLRRYEIHDNSRMTDPWSLRQMTVYQRFDFATGKSTWFFIRPFQGCMPMLRKFILDERACHPMMLHLLLLTTATENWRWHIDFLRRRLADFTEKAKFSRFDAHYINYDVQFADTQRLATLESKLTIAVSVLEQSLSIGNGMKLHCERMRQISDQSFDPNVERAMANDFDVQLASLKLHKVSCELLLQQLRGTCELLVKVLDHRSNLMMEAQSKISTDLTRASNIQTHALNVLAHESKRDSRAMRILTTVAMAYVPASLVASVFSSGLIKTSDGDITTDSFHVSKDMWIFVLSSFVATIVTMAPAFFWTGFKKN